MKKIITFLFFILVLSNCIIIASAQNNSVLLVEVAEVIDQATVELISDAIDEAQVTNAKAIILLLDTPGGGADQTFQIADLILESTIPIVGYVFPKGATAWSAGTFILISTHVAAMAPNTIIGSAQPIEISVEGSRLINDSKRINALVEWITERATIYGRNTTLAAEFITKNRNVNASEALQFNAIEIITPTVQDLLEKMDGMSLKIANDNIILDTKNAEIIEFTPSISIQFLKILSNPILTSLLLILGIFALIFGISSPGLGAEIFGVIAILLSLLGSGFNIPVISGFLIILGAILLFIEIFVTPGFGVLGTGGAICLIIGSVFLIPDYTNRGWLISMEWTSTALIVLIVVAILIVVFFLFLLYKILKIRTKKTVVGTFVGERAKAIDQITPEKAGYVRYKGEYWQAKSDEIIEPNTKVIIVDKDESILKVKPKK
jgi:membrane-bound serine protease (ClpP class)